jgi:hypothetical protein
MPPYPSPCPTTIRWHRAGPSSWTGSMPGSDPAEDGCIVAAFRTAAVAARCPQCGRTASLWQVNLGLPEPFPVVGAVGRGCTREHALGVVPRT